MGPIQATKVCMQKYATMSGRASGSEFWWFWLLHFLLPFTSLFVAVFFVPSESRALATTLIYAGIALYLITTPPTFCSVVRRFHDTGRTGKFSIMFIAAMAIIVVNFYVVFTFFAKSMTVGAFVDPGPILYALPALLVIDGAIFWVLFVFILLPLLAVALILFIILATMLAAPSQPDSNKYGPNPQEVTP